MSQTIPSCGRSCESSQRAARLKVYGWFVLAVAVLGTAIYYFSRAHSGGLV